MHAAAYEGRVDVVQQLLLRNSDSSVDAADEQGATPLHHAVKGGRLAVVKLLLGWSVSTSAVTAAGLTPVLACCSGTTTCSSQWSIC